VRIAPEEFSSYGVKDSEVCVPDRRGFVIVGNGVFVNGTGFVNGASLASQPSRRSFTTRTCWMENSAAKKDSGLTRC